MLEALQTAAVPARCAAATGRSPQPACQSRGAAIVPVNGLKQRAAGGGELAGWDARKLGSRRRWLSSQPWINDSSANGSKVDWLGMGTTLCRSKAHARMPQMTRRACNGFTRSFCPPAACIICSLCAALPGGGPCSPTGARSAAAAAQQRSEALHGMLVCSNGRQAQCGCLEADGRGDCRRRHRLPPACHCRRESSELNSRCCCSAFMQTSPQL